MLAPPRPLPPTMTQRCLRTSATSTPSTAQRAPLPLTCMSHCERTGPAARGMDAVGCQAHGQFPGGVGDVAWSLAAVQSICSNIVLNITDLMSFCDCMELNVPSCMQVARYLARANSKALCGACGACSRSRLPTHERCSLRL